MHLFDFYVFVAVSGLLIFGLGLVSRELKAHVGPPVLIVLVGIALAAAMPQPHEDLLDDLETLSWFAVGFGVASIALRFRRIDMHKMWRPAALITSCAMCGMWAVSSLVVWALFDVPVSLAVLVGAIVTPTDPVVASSIVTGPFAEKHIPPRIRTLLSLESGANDGLGFAFVFLPMLLLEHGQSGWIEWIQNILLWQVVCATLVGSGSGWLAGKVCDIAISRGEWRHLEILLVSIAFTVLVLGLMKVLAMDSIWALFVAAMVFSFLLPLDQREAANAFHEGIVYVTMVPALLVFGMTLPWAEWLRFGPAAIAAIAAVLLLRRLPVIGLVYAFIRTPTLPSEPEERLDQPFAAPRDLWFCGWFGPIGLSAVYYATTAHRLLGDARVWPIASLLVFGSIVVHGVTAAIGTRWYARAA